MLIFNNLLKQFSSNKNLDLLLNCNFIDMKTNYLFLLIFFISCTPVKKTHENESDKIFVAAYYFPNYHTGDPRNDLNMGKDWSEWELVKAAQPRFPGHQQPKVPAWGYVDEKDQQK